MAEPLDEPSVPRTQRIWSDGSVMTYTDEKSHRREDFDKFHYAVENDSSINSPTVVTPPHKEGDYFQSLGEPHDPRSPAPQDVEKKADRQQSRTRRICNWRNKTCRWLLLGALFAIACSVGVGVGVPLALKKTGAMRGTGVVGIDPNDGTPKITLYYQHHSGAILESIFEHGTWSKGEMTNAVVTPNAKKGTPLMALSYAHHDELTWKVFYVDKNNYIQESINSNKSSGWSSGLLGNGKYKISSSPTAGLTACVNRQWYGDSETGIGIRLYFSAASGSVQELSWKFGDGAWDKGYTFPDSNGDGGCECTVRGTSITNVWLLNSKTGNLEQRWYDFNRSAKTDTHKVGEWVTQLTYAPVRPNSAISAINLSNSSVKLVHFQSPTSSIIELTANGTAETSRWPLPADTVGDVPGADGTKLSSVVLNTDLGGQEIHVFFQTGKNDVSDFIRTLVGETWSQRRLSIPR